MKRFISINAVRAVGILTVCIAVMLLGLASTPGSALANSDCIDFETLPDGTQTSDTMTIDNQYWGQSTPYTGVKFSLSNGKYPKIAKVGKPVTAFQGSPNTKDQKCWDSVTTDDMPRVLDQPIVECSFLTSYNPGDQTPPDLIVDYYATVTKASGYILDIDVQEKWRITAYMSLSPVGTPLELVAGSVNTGDGVATLWTMSVPTGFNRLVFHYCGVVKEVGLAFDNFCTDTIPGQDIPTLSEWGLIGLMLVLLALGTWVFFWRRKVIGGRL